ncbi:hypothetical protein BDA96_03G186300 [Sorghum bicolor]|uniref:Uncharacterized protein n=1 Tax=Sorghum bicolor TaxID=4558 RepID=A0A921RE16_SORBI|nr:hypothetical protein BDA96_03G186300 [Sorghum bicolor]
MLRSNSSLTSPPSVGPAPTPPRAGTRSRLIPLPRLPPTHHQDASASAIPLPRLPPTRRQDASASERAVSRTYARHRRRQGAPPTPARHSAREDSETPAHRRNSTPGRAARGFATGARGRDCGRGSRPGRAVGARGQWRAAASTPSCRPPDSATGRLHPGRRQAATPDCVQGHDVGARLLGAVRPGLPLAFCPPLLPHLALCVTCSACGSGEIQPQNAVRDGGGVRRYRSSQAFLSPVPHPPLDLLPSREATPHFKAAPPSRCSALACACPQPHWPSSNLGTNRFEGQLRY